MVREVDRQRQSECVIHMPTSPPANAWAGRDKEGEGGLPPQLQKVYPGFTTCRPGPDRHMSDDPTYNAQDSAHHRRPAQGEDACRRAKRRRIE